MEPDVKTRKPLSAEHRAAISAGVKGKLKGRKLSAETRGKMSAAQKGVPKTEKWLATRIGVPLSGVASREHQARDAGLMGKEAAGNAVDAATAP